MSESAKIEVQLTRTYSCSTGMYFKDDILEVNTPEEAQSLYDQKIAKPYIPPAKPAVPAEEATNPETEESPDEKAILTELAYGPPDAGNEPKAEVTTAGE